MPTIDVAIDAWLEPALDCVEGVDLVEPMVVAPDPGPGDPDAEPIVWAEPAFGPRVQAMLCRTVTHEIVGELRTAVVDDWEEDVDEPPGASVTASSWDPLWSQVAAHTASHRGRPIYDWDPKGHELLIGLDGNPEWTGVFRQPLDIGGDRVALPARGPEILLAERTLGLVEQTDWLAGWGDFERYPVGTVPPGLVLVPKPGHTMTATIVLDAVRGRHCLQLTGAGWARTPKVALPGQDSVGRTAGVSAFAKTPTGVAAGTPIVATYTQRADALVPSNRDYTLFNVGSTPDPDGRWSKDPIGSKARMSTDAINHWTWGELRSFDDHPTRYDLVRLTEGVLTGFLTSKTYDHYVALLIEAMQYGEGGAPWGMTSRIESHATGSIEMSWGHTAHHTGSEAMAMVTDVDGGAAWTVNPAWVARIMAERGQRRTDVLLGPDQVLECRWAQDPGAEVDDYIADTGRGSGSTLVTSTWSAPFEADRHRITSIVRPPVDRSLNAIDAWTRRHGPVAHRRQVTCELDVRWRYGRGIACGDTVPVALVDGLLGHWITPMRVVKRRMRPREGIVTLTMGNADA